MDTILLEREHPESPPSPGDYRDPTERDRDRILHSAAFRRLQGKTQVFGIGQADFYRTRLTHSLEVAQLARSIAHNLLVVEPRLQACLTPSLAEAAALAHDLGHPPFGHGGERTLDACMKDISRRTGLRGRKALRFEGNAQTFHILVAAEPKSPDFPGLNLTRATLAGVIKYPFEQHMGNDKFIFSSDAPSARWALAGGTQLVSTRKVSGTNQLRTSISCQILDWADDCAYSIHDIEDALQAQFLRPSDLQEPRFAGRVREHYEQNRKSESVPSLGHQEFQERMLALERRIKPSGAGDERAHRKLVVRDILDELVTSVGIVPWPGRRRADFNWRLQVPPEMRVLAAMCKSIVWEAVITDPRVAAMTMKGKEILKDLFQLLSSELTEKRSTALFPRWIRPRLEECLGKGESEAAREVCNYLALLTDAEALRLHAVLRGSQGTTFFDLI